MNPRPDDSFRLFDGRILPVFRNGKFGRGVWGDKWKSSKENAVARVPPGEIAPFCDRPETYVTPGAAFTESHDPRDADEPIPVSPVMGPAMEEGAETRHRAPSG